MISMPELLVAMSEHDASDLHLTVGAPPILRVHGHLVPLDYPRLTEENVTDLAYSIITSEQKERFEANLELDFSFGVAGLSRYRVNMYHQRGAVGVAIRAIPHQAKGFEELGLPAEICDSLCQKTKGLILFTGPTGHGKTTSMAAMIERINQRRDVHIVTVEDPIEYLINHNKAIVNQREVGTDTHSFPAALKYVLRQDPDVVLIGEMRDLETIQAALTIAETGHLTFATLHTSSCAQSIDRIIDVFPPHQQSQVRAQLSLVLEAVFNQQLIPRRDGKGRVLAIEILIVTLAIRNLIRESKIHEIYSALQVGQKYGMRTMNQSLADAYHRGLISRQEALSRTLLPDELLRMMDEGSQKSARR